MQRQNHPQKIACQSERRQLNYGMEEQHTCERTTSGWNKNENAREHKTPTSTHPRHKWRPLVKKARGRRPIDQRDVFMPDENSKIMMARPKANYILVFFFTLSK